MLNLKEHKTGLDPMLLLPNPLQKQERAIQPTLQPNPSYEPLEVGESAVEMKDAHKKNSVPEEQETSVDTKK